MSVAATSLVTPLIASELWKIQRGGNRLTDQGYAAVKELSACLDGFLTRLDAIVSADLESFNRSLGAKHLDPAKP